MSLPPVTVIVLNWNAEAYLEACLSSLLAQDYPAFDLLLVDNASGDGSLALAHDRFPDLTILPLSDNLGFAAGNNAALAQVKTPFAVLANPDIVAPPNWLRALMAPMAADPTIGVAGSQTRYPDGTLQHAGGILRPPQALAAYRRDEDEQVADVDYVIGAAFAVRMALLAEIGLLDEGYFLYYEEADLCARVRRAGHRVVYVPSARLTHVESATTPKGDAAYLRRLHTSRWRYLLKHAAGDVLLQQTVPAETEWLAGRNAVERQAVALAYYATASRLPDLLAARARHGMTPLAATQARALGEALQTLWAVAWAGDTSRLGNLASTRRVMERPFTSSVPLIGGLIARIRELWSSVAVRWYVRALWVQQNRFNELLVSQLAVQQKRLRQQAAEQAGLALAIAELEEQITTLETRSGAGN